ncbi:hypothetical protein HYR69_02825 [Candidatus Sumerlaeota bacterium]|nr:hypothetical protein [Candidatus Sumerlaeota bacterium]
MVYRGHVKSGMIVLDDRAQLPEGTEVEVQVHGQTTATPPKESTAAPTLNERLKSIVGRAQGLPSDAARNHDHYLYGLPRK